MIKCKLPLFFLATKAWNIWLSDEEGVLRDLAMIFKGGCLRTWGALHLGVLLGNE